MVRPFVFFLGGHDAEMCAIKEILEAEGLPFYDKNLSWGATLSDYKEELKTLRSDNVAVLVELAVNLPLPENAIVIDHHCEKAGTNKPTSIEQIADLLGLTLNRRQQLIAANDRAHIKGLKAIGADEREIEAISVLSTVVVKALVKRRSGRPPKFVQNSEAPAHWIFWKFRSSTPRLSPTGFSEDTKIC